jgi:hypothetical protein
MVVRSGGHSSAGFSGIDEGVVLDTSKLDDVIVYPHSELLHAGPGAEFRRVWEIMGRHGLAVTAGVCSDVRVGGYMQGGGYGWNARMFGMNCDNVLEVEIMLADGSVVVANERTNADLFYGVRGGTGNNFGVLLRVTYQLHLLREVHGFSIVWDLGNEQGAANGAAALSLMQQTKMGSNKDRRLGMHVILAYQADNPDLSDSRPWLMLRVMFNGSRDEGLSTLRDVLDTPGAILQWDKRGTVAEINLDLINKPHGIPQFKPNVDILPEAKESRYLDRPLGLDNWRKVVDYFRSSQTRLNPYTCAAIEVAGGAINEFPVDTNAYIHRATDGDIFFDVFWENEGQRKSALDYLRDWVSLIEPLSNLQVYQNYPSEDLTRWWWRYWGDAAAVLWKIKGKYDPTSLFDFPQSLNRIPPEGRHPLIAPTSVLDGLKRPIERLGPTSTTPPAP